MSLFLSIHCSTFVVYMYRVLCLLFNPSSLVTPLLDYLAAIKFSCYQLCYENVLLVIKEKQLSLMNHLGGIGKIGLC